MKIITVLYLQNDRRRLLQITMRSDSGMQSWRTLVRIAEIVDLRIDVTYGIGSIPERHVTSAFEVSQATATGQRAWGLLILL